MFARFLRLALIGLPMIAGRLPGADRAAEIAALHREAIGGAERIEALSSYRADGTVTAGGRRVRFTLLAARPARVRLETGANGRTLVQGTDGEEPAWEFDTGTWPPRYRPMPEAVARTFVADAEFDDPLVAGAERGFAVEYAGEVEEGGRRFARLTVTRRLRETFTLHVDLETCLIHRRIDERTSAGGRPRVITTQYEDFRPVEGVLLPHRVVVLTDGRLTQETRIDAITARPTLSPDTFRRPAAKGPEKRSP